MNDKEKLQRLRELLEERKKDLENENENKNNNQSMNKSQGSKQITIGAHPETGTFFSRSVEEDPKINRNGFSTILMLSFLTFFFETIFLVISYLIFK